jgi:hypothetical protein
MAVKLTMENPNSVPDNERLFKKASNRGFFSDFWDFLRTSRKWWMLPLLVLLLLLGVILVLGKTAVAPFIYTLF